jgi:DNA topoisomerase VI subunit B
VRRYLLENKQSRRRFLSVLGLGALGAFLYSLFVPKSAQAMSAVRDVSGAKRQKLSMDVKKNKLAVKRKG